MPAPLRTPLPRHLHPVAWWVWAMGLAVACSGTTNPLLLALAVSVAAFVVAARRGSSPWARSFRLYLWLGAFIIVLRVVLHVLDVRSGQTFVCSFTDFASVSVEPLEGQWVPQPTSDERARAARFALEEARLESGLFERLFEELARRANKPERR